MEQRIYYKDLECYQRATEKQIRAMNKSSPYYDLELLPTEGLKREIASFIIDRGRAVSLITIKGERNHYNQICRFLREINFKGDSLLCRTQEQWIKLFKAWRIQKGLALIKPKTSIYGKPLYEVTAAVRYFSNIIEYVQPEDRRAEREKDIWILKNLDIPVRENLIKNFQTLNFKDIIQKELRSEIKEALYYHLQFEALNTIVREISVMRQFSKYLHDHFPSVQSCRDINRDILEEYLIHLKVDGRTSKGNRDTILKLRSVLETVGKILDMPDLARLFLNTDIPPDLQSEFKVYSDAEIKRLNAGIAKLDIQIARAMVIHQMLGNRISDTLTLRRDCLSKIADQNMITIHQMKTKTFQKPISLELAQLIQKAIEYSKEHFAESPYIFVNETDTSRPLQYQTIVIKVVGMIHKENIRDDKGKLFGFNSHLYRHYYGVKLTEMHLDDWTIAKLLGHKGLGSVKYYRRMSNQLMADETRKARQALSDIILANLDGWGEEYEQIR